MFNRFNTTVSFNIMAKLQGQCLNIFMESAKRTMEKKVRCYFVEQGLFCLLSIYIYSRSFVKRDLCKKKKIV